MMNADHYDHAHDDEPVLSVGERYKRMLNAFRRAPTLTKNEVMALKLRYRAAREKVVGPLVAALASLIVADLTRGRE